MLTLHERSEPRSVSDLFPEMITSNALSLSLPLVEFLYLVFTRISGESYRRRGQAFVVVFVLREDKPLVEFLYLVFTRMSGESRRRFRPLLLYLCYVRMYLWWSFCTLYSHACHVRVVGDSGLCCCTCVT